MPSKLKPPRLPEYVTLDEAASWLTTLTEETWAVSAVLSSMLEWKNHQTQTFRLFAPETVYVVIHKGDELLDASREHSKISVVSARLLALCATQNTFLSELRDAGFASPGYLTDRSVVGSRYFYSRPIQIRDVRIHRVELEQMLQSLNLDCRISLPADSPEFSALIKEMQEQYLLPSQGISVGLDSPDVGVLEDSMEVAVKKAISARNRKIGSKQWEKDIPLVQHAVDKYRTTMNCSIPRAAQLLVPEIIDMALRLGRKFSPDTAEERIAGWLRRHCPEKKGTRSNKV